MKGKQLLLLLLLVAALGGVGYYLQKRNKDSWSGTGAGAGGKVLDFPINEVARVTIKNASGEVNLVKRNEAWTVQERADYPASFEQVSGLLRKLWELKTVQEVKVGPSQMPRLELVEPGKGDAAGTLIELKDKDGKSLDAALLGKKHMRKSDGGPMDFGGFPTGRYVMPVGGKKVSLVSETLDDAEPKPERWLVKDFLKIETPTSITLAGQADTMRWKVTRENATADWKLTEAKADEQLDAAKVSQFGTILGSPNFKDVLAPDAKPEETGLDKPTTATIETADQFTYTLKIGKLTNEAYPVQFTIAANFAKERTPGKDEKPEEKTKLDEEFKAKQKRLEEKLATEKKFEGRAYLVEKFTIEPLLKDRSALLAEKKPEPAPATPSAPPTPPVSITTPPVSVTTPPVSLPPQPTTSEPTPAPPTAPPPEASPTMPKPSEPTPQPAPATPPTGPAAEPVPSVTTPTVPAPPPPAPSTPPAAPPASPATPAAEKAPETPAPPKPPELEGD